MNGQADDPDGGEKKNSKRRKVTRAADAKRLLIGAGARVLFYPTLLYNILRSKLQSEFRWWDLVDEFLLLGAVPFPRDVPRLKQLGVGGVITLSEPFETLVAPSLYKEHGIDHLVIPTRDYLYAPSFIDINAAVDFIHKNASSGRTTYVHCKAGRGRSTTIALCYLVKQKHMTPVTALEMIQSKRPRVLLTPLQEKAVQEYHKRCLIASGEYSSSKDAVLPSLSCVEWYDESCNGLVKELECVPQQVKAKAGSQKAKQSSLFASLRYAGKCVKIPGQMLMCRAD
ncbi:Phosphatidylglycerophosphate phosphatase ptpmt2 [Ancistrocladus abbreviatus]